MGGVVKLLVAQLKQVGLVHQRYNAKGGRIGNDRRGCVTFCPADQDVIHCLELEADDKLLIPVET